MKALVVFYSLEGHTKLLANAVATAAGADILEIRPKKDIPTRGFIKYLRGGGQVIRKVKPEIYPVSANPVIMTCCLSALLSGPGFAPAGTFLSSARLKGKKIALSPSTGVRPGMFLSSCRKPGE